MGLARGHDVAVVNPMRCAILLGADAPVVLHAGEPLAAHDAVVSRLGGRPGGHAFAIARQLELGGTYCVNRTEAIARARDKMCTLQRLAAQGLPVVPTAVAHRVADVRLAFERLGGPPVVVKIVDGTQGAGVALVESLAAAESVVEALLAAHRHVLLQEFIPHASDMRLFVVGRRVVAGMRRVARAGNFRANIHQGGTGEALNPDDAQRALALSAAAALGLEIAGVDLLETPAGPVVVEVNASPGLEGIESASGRNVAGAIVQFVESKVRERQPV